MWLATATSAFVLRGAGRWLWRAITEPERVVVLGEGSLAEAVLRKLALFPDIHAEIAGVHGPREIDPSEYERVLDGVDRVIVASSTIDQSLIVSLLAFCRTRRAKLTIVPPTHGMFGTAVELSHVADLPLVEFHTGDVPRSTLLLKRALDVVASAFALVVLSPLLLGIALAIRIDSCGPVMFTQRRAGQGGQPFRMYKFRTMVAEAEELLRDLVSFDDLKEPMFKLRNDPRVTRVGGFLRRTSLDELPQLLNVLKGEMSLVGPRPEQLELAKRYSEPQSFRLAVKPGLTGPMQVFGRGELTFEERLAVEREYIENLSLGRDLRIMVLTLPAVVSGKGAF
jgi:exopolysaccharide biosynthesis polyprenyl glycosylphosphotransferase